MKENNNKCVSNFDRDDEFKQQIFPLIQQIYQICSVKNIPFFVAVATANNKDGTTYYSNGIIPDTHGLVLTEDNFTKLIGVMHGMDTVDRGDDSDNIDYGAVTVKEA